MRRMRTSATSANLRPSCSSVLINSQAARPRSTGATLLAGLLLAGSPALAATVTPAAGTPASAAAPAAAAKPAAPAATPAPAAAKPPTPEEEAKKRAAALKEFLEKDHATIEDALRASMAGPHRKEGRFWRDAYRHPLETLTFFGLKQDQTVLELSPGEGWYTELLAPVLQKKGELRVQTGDPNSNYGRRFYNGMKAAPEVYAKVKTVVVADPKVAIDLGPPESVDLVLTFRNLHNWYDSGTLESTLAATFKVLKKGGTFGVVEHRAKVGQKPEDGKKSGYLPEAFVIAQIQKAGFKLVKKSEVNANKKDTKDYAEGVWTLPPNLALKEKDRERYMAIGESDRMTLRFVKP